MCSVIAIQILDAFLFSSGNQNLPQSDQALYNRVDCKLCCDHLLLLLVTHSGLCTAVLLFKNNAYCTWLMNCTTRSTCSLPLLFPLEQLYHHLVVGLSNESLKLYLHTCIIIQYHCACLQQQILLFSQYSVATNAVTKWCAWGPGILFVCFKDFKFRPRPCNCSALTD